MSIRTKLVSIAHDLKNAAIKDFRADAEKGHPKLRTFIGMLVVAFVGQSVMNSRVKAAGLPSGIRATTKLLRQGNTRPDTLTPAQEAAYKSILGPQALTVLILSVLSVVLNRKA